MSDILFIRHAETDMAGTFCGHSDPELNARGHAQVAELIDSLREEKIRMVYTSDLRRAQATADSIVGAFNFECEVRPALREINFGCWEGLTWKQIEEQDKAYACRWVAEHPYLSAPGGEEFPDFEHRVMEEMEYLSAKATERDIAVVTHGGVLRTVLCQLRGSSQEDAWKQAIPHCAIVRHTVPTPPGRPFLEVVP